MRFVRIGMAAVAAGSWLIALPAGAESLIAMTDMVAPEAPGAHVMTFYVELAPGEEVPMHSHGGTGVVVVVEGSLKVRDLDGTEHDFKAGDNFSEPSGAVHSAVITSSEPAKLIWTIVLPDGAELQTDYKG